MFFVQSRSDLLKILEYAFWRLMSGMVAITVEQKWRDNVLKGSGASSKRLEALGPL